MRNRARTKENKGLVQVLTAKVEGDPIPKRSKATRKGWPKRRCTALLHCFRC